MIEKTAVLESLPRSGEADFAPSFTHKSPPLCSNTVQVPSFDYNSINVNELAKEMICGYLFEHGHWKDADAIQTCGSEFVHLKDVNGHEKYVKKHCGHDYCPICGVVGSKAHKKRSARAMDRLLWVEVLGYMVFTLPKEISLNMPDKEKLSDLSKKAWDLVKKNFDTPGGMARIHLMGEEPEKLHIHVNVLFPIVNKTGRGEVPREMLDVMRSEWTEYVNKAFGLKYENTNVFYKFAYQEGRKIHQVEYVLRPVITPGKFLTLSDNDREKVIGLRGWHNTRWFGKLANSQYKEYLTSVNVEVTKYEDKDVAISKRCPICGEKFRFVEICHKSKIDKVKMGLRAIDDDTLVDFSIYSYLKENSS